MELKQDDSFYLELPDYTVAERLETLALTCPPDLELCAAGKAAILDPEDNEQEPIKVHKSILARYSDTFRKMCLYSYLSWWWSTDRTSSPAVSRLSYSVSNDTLKLLIDLMYEGRVTVSKPTRLVLYELTSAARELGFSRARIALLRWRFPLDVEVWHHYSRPAQLSAQVYRRELLDSAACRLLDDDDRQAANEDEAEIETQAAQASSKTGSSANRISASPSRGNHSERCQHNPSSVHICTTSTSTSFSSSPSASSASDPYVTPDSTMHNSEQTEILLLDDEETQLPVTTEAYIEQHSNLCIEIENNETMDWLDTDTESGSSSACSSVLILEEQQRSLIEGIIASLRTEDDESSSGERKNDSININELRDEKEMNRTKAKATEVKESHARIVSMLRRSILLDHSYARARLGHS